MYGNGFGPAWLPYDSTREQTCSGFGELEKERLELCIHRTIIWVNGNKLEYESDIKREKRLKLMYTLRGRDGYYLQSSFPA